MIILRQKTHSKSLVLKKVKSAGTSLNNLRDDIYNVIYRNNPTMQLTSRLVREQGEKNVENLSNNLAQLVPKSKTKAKKLLEQGKSKLVDLVKRPKEKKVTTEELQAKLARISEYVKTHSPGQTAEEVMGNLVKNPVGVGGTIGGYAMVPLVGYVPGTTPASWALQGFVTRTNPGSVLAGGLYPTYRMPLRRSIPRGARNLVYKVGQEINWAGERLGFGRLWTPQQLSRGSVRAGNVVKKYIPLPKSNISPEHLINGTTESLVTAFQ